MGVVRKAGCQLVWSRRLLFTSLLLWLDGSMALADGLTIPAADAAIKTVGGKIAGGDAALGGWNLWSNGELGDYVTFPADGAYRITVRAYGSPAKGSWPLMGLVLDGRRIAFAKVDFDLHGDPKSPTAATCQVTLP